MFGDVLGAIDGVEIFPVVGLVIFVLVFAAIVVWVIRLDKKTIAEAERLPLESDRSIQEETIHG